MVLRSDALARVSIRAVNSQKLALYRCPPELVLRPKECGVNCGVARWLKRDRLFIQYLMDKVNGGRGIRTPGTVSRTTVFKTAAFNHSAIPPVVRITETTDASESWTRTKRRGGAPL